MKCFCGKKEVLEIATLLKVFASGSHEEKIAEIVKLWDSYGSYTKRDRAIIDVLVAGLRPSPV